MKDYLVGISVFNEGEKIKRTLHRFNNFDLYDVVIVDDGSTDHALENLPAILPNVILRNEICRGAGFTIRQTIRYAREKGYGYVIFVSGNDKDDSRDILKMVQALNDGYDFVQGSRYMPGGHYGQMPFYRVIATRFIHPWLFSFITGRKVTDSTNGFRALKLSIFEDKKIDIDQAWLDQYELEPYLFFYAIKLGYKVTEVPVTKIYPSREEGFTKMKPWVGWWSILRPLVYLGLGWRK